MKNKPSLFLVLGISVAGLLVGFSAKRATIDHRSSQAGSSAPPIHQSNSPTENPPAKIPVSAAKSTPGFAARHSTDTLETLAALDEEHLYARLALWLMDASAADIAAYWSGDSAEKNSDAFASLVFLNWTRLDPQAAIAATAGTSNDYLGWWAWACHDPKASLVAAIAAGPDFVESVAMGIGEFHPEWLRQHLQEIPESAREAAVQAMSKWDVMEKPLESLKFMKENGGDPEPETLKALARQDPWAAFDWAKQQSDTIGYRSIQDPIQVVIETMATEYPDDLARLAAQTPSGEVKLKMEAAMFANLLKTDPAAALEQADSTTIPRTAAERYAAIGLSLTKTDPEQALHLAQRLLTACPDALNMSIRIELPDDSTATSGITIPGVDDFITELITKSPARLMDLSIGTARQEDGPFDRFSQQWIERDPVAYTNWINQQNDAKAREAGGEMIVRNLQQQQHFEEAAEWAMSLKDAERDPLRSLLADWTRSDPEAASNWLESSDLPPDRKAEIKSLVKLLSDVQ